MIYITPIKKRDYVVPSGQASGRTWTAFRNHTMSGVREVMASRNTADGELKARFYCLKDGCNWIGWFPLDELKKLAPKSKNRGANLDRF
jgi:hypothetical protein